MRQAAVAMGLGFVPFHRTILIDCSVGTAWNFRSMLELFLQFRARWLIAPKVNK
jgi:hypothetical protein